MSATVVVGVELLDQGRKLMEYQGYKIVGDGTFGHMVIKSIGPGAIPRDLSGAYTSSEIAQRAVDNYVDRKKIEDARIAAIRDARPTPIELKQPKEELTDTALVPKEPKPEGVKTFLETEPTTAPDNKE